MAVGGRLAYIHDDWDFEMTSSPFQDPVETISFKIKKTHTAHLHILGIYRPESGSLPFRRMISEFMDSSPQNTYILGDMNIDISSFSSNAKILKSLLLQHNYTQVIQSATRITDKTKTLIDLIITNSPDKQCESNVITTGIADHELIYTIRSKSSKEQTCPKVIKVRSIKNLNPEAINKFIEQGPWWSFSLNSNVDNCFNIFTEIIKIAFDKFAPEKSMRVKRHGPRTPIIKKLISERDNSKLKCNESPESWEHFRQLRNKCVKLIKIEKAKELENIAANNDNPSKSHWKLFNEEIGRKQSESTIKSINNSNLNQILTCNQEIADYFCDTLTTESPNLIDSPNDFTNPDWTPTSQCEKLADFSFSLSEIRSTIKKLKNYKAPGIDGVTPEMLKIVSPSISPILCYLLNLSSEQAIYPQCLKETIITPVYKKKGAKNDAGNYRPISVVPVIAKVYENLICNRIVMHL
ncbi:LINE-1 reverse transcriptase [Folsomia candida]|uniref:LINE-1 reverse transcriptase n=1 Tax=Folsomia candida TaxID=158441 RepID=A0A226DQQ1_FOLCA|nr:LINE-1 reverse transcriptase [Folsomia candida]